MLPYHWFCPVDGRMLLRVYGESALAVYALANWAEHIKPSAARIITKLIWLFRGSGTRRNVWPDDRLAGRRQPRVRVPAPVVGGIPDRVARPHHRRHASGVSRASWRAYFCPFYLLYALVSYDFFKIQVVSGENIISVVIKSSCNLATPYFFVFLLFLCEI